MKARITRAAVMGSMRFTISIVDSKPGNSRGTGVIGPSPHGKFMNEGSCDDVRRAQNDGHQHVQLVELALSGALWRLRQARRRVLPRVPIRVLGRAFLRRKGEMLDRARGSAREA